MEAQPAQTPLASGLLTPKAAPWTPGVLKPSKYAALSETLRVYAGWVLAWYIIIAALEGLSELRGFQLLPSFFQDIFSSASLFAVSFACFLFLLLGSVYRALGKRIVVGIVLFLLGLAVFTLYMQNIA